MTPLTGLDSLFLHLETPETPMHVASLHVFDLPEGYRGNFAADVRRHFAARLHLAPLFRRRLRSFPLAIANPVWVDDAAVDLDDHLGRVRLPRPGTHRQLEACVARLHSIPLERSRPLWEARVIEGLATGQAVLYMKIHHAVLDGAAGVALADLLLDREPVLHEMPRPRGGKRFPAEAPGFAALAGAALRHDVAQYATLVARLPDLARELAGAFGVSDRSLASTSRGRLMPGPRTPFNVAITAERGVAATSLPLAEAMHIAKVHDAKLNDVVLALCSGALRQYLGSHGGIPAEPLIAGMPFSLREAGDAGYSTQATMTRVNLATDVADPVARLRAIRDASSAVKATTRRVQSLIPTDTPSLGAPWVLGGLATLYGRSKLADSLPPIMNVVISNVPGPREPRYAAGARMRTYWPLSIVEHGLGLNITVVSYEGALDFGLVAARRAVPEVRTMARALEAAHAELLQATPASRERAGRKGRRA